MIKNTPHIKIVCFTLVMFVCFMSKQQAQIVINNSGIINVNGGTTAAISAYVVLNNPPATPIKTIGITGGFMLETEFSITQYNIGAGTTPITVPYYSITGGSTQFPLGVTGISGGIGAGKIRFSSKRPAALATGWQNSSYMPSGVVNMNGWNLGVFTADNSANAIDRFWIIDANGYSTTPGATYSFGYIYNEGNINGGNTAGLQPNLQAEPWDQLAVAWAGSPTGSFPAGANTSSLPTGTVSGVSIAAGLMGTKYRSWTLVNKLNPLPVELLAFTGTCLNNRVTILWNTASESNSNYFTIEKSFDGQNFTWLANINAAGNSTQQNNYTYFDENSASLCYYKLSETDKNGAEKTYKIISVADCNSGTAENIHVFSSNENINLNVYSLSNQAVSIAVYDVTGRIIYKENVIAVVGNNNYILNPQVAKGIYMVKVQTNTTSLTKQVPLVN